MNTDWIGQLLAEELAEITESLGLDYSVDIDQLWATLVEAVTRTSPGTTEAKVIEKFLTNRNQITESSPLARVEDSSSTDDEFRFANDNPRSSTTQASSLPAIPLITPRGTIGILAWSVTKSCTGGRQLQCVNPVNPIHQYPNWEPQTNWTGYVAPQ